MMYQSFADGRGPLDRTRHDRPADQRDRDRPRRLDGGRMISHPTAAELTEAIAAFEAEPVVPGDARQAFLIRVTDNARATLAREAEHGARLEAEAIDRLLRAAGRDGRLRRVERRTLPAD
ncbi:hypothetical protein ACRAWD_15555 [Caulobacter segnis]